MSTITFSPSEELLKLQAIELDLLNVFKSACKKLGLTYYAIGGTLLGAARHKGFIPWDDDMDLAMPWRDFKVLMESGPSEFKPPYCFQCYKHDINADVSPTAKIRNSLTTGCMKWEYDNVKTSSHNKGIFIDIFPLFDIPDDGSTMAIQKMEIEKAWKAIRGWNAVQNNKVGYSSIYEQYIGDWELMSKSYTIEQIKQKYIDACAMVEGVTEEIGLTACRTHYSKLIWKREWFNDVIELAFENTTISCPKYFDEVLTKEYGDWRIPVFNGALHEMFILNTNIPFSENDKLSF